MSSLREFTLKEGGVVRILDGSVVVRVMEVGVGQVRLRVEALSGTSVEREHALLPEGYTDNSRG